MSILYKYVTRIIMVILMIIVVQRLRSKANNMVDIPVIHHSFDPQLDHIIDPQIKSVGSYSAPSLPPFRLSFYIDSVQCPSLELHSLVDLSFSLHLKILDPNFFCFSDRCHRSILPHKRTQAGRVELIQTDQGRFLSLSLL